MKSLYLLVGLCLLFGQTHGQPLEAEVRKAEANSRDERPPMTMSSSQDLVLLDVPSKPLPSVTVTADGFKPIAFTATNPVVLNKKANPVPLAYRNVLTNVGEAYSPDTGIFTAPFHGVYYFSFHSYFGAGTTASAGGLFFNNNNREIVSWYGKDLVYDKSASNGAVLELRHGDSVFMGLWPKPKIGQKYSSFSGYLLYPM